MKRISVFVVLVLVIATPNIVAAQGPGPTTPPYILDDGCIDAQEDWWWVEQIAKQLGGFVVFEPQGIMVVFQMPTLDSITPSQGYLEGFFHWPVHDWYLGEVFQVNFAIQGREAKCHYISFILSPGAVG